MKRMKRRGWYASCTRRFCIFTITSITTALLLLDINSWRDAYYLYAFLYRNLIRQQITNFVALSICLCILSYFIYDYFVVQFISLFNSLFLDLVILTKDFIVLKQDKTSKTVFTLSCIYLKRNQLYSIRNVHRCTTFTHEEMLPC
jgi:hypothetical protein